MRRPVRGAVDPHLDDPDAVVRLGDRVRQIRAGRHHLVPDAVRPAQCPQIGCGRGAEDALEVGGPLGRPGFEGREDAAAVIVDDDEREVGHLLPRPDEQPVGVVEEGQVAHQRDGRDQVAGQGDTNRGGDHPVDAGEPAVGEHLVGDRARDGQVEVAHRVARAEHEHAVTGEAIDDRAGDREAARPRERLRSNGIRESCGGTAPLMRPAVVVIGSGRAPQAQGGRRVHGRGDV